MVLPTTAPVIITINGIDVSSLLASPDSLNITMERNTSIGSASFTLESVYQLGLTSSDITQWSIVTITSPDETVTYFGGYITRFTQRKVGIRIDYDIECEGWEVRLQKSVVAGEFSGTDGDILADLFAATIPDLSSLFDFATDVTPVLSTSTYLAIEDISLLDAMDRLANLVGAKWRINPSGRTSGKTRWNIITNPNMESNMNGYGGTIPNAYTPPPDLWNPANVVYNGNAGVSGTGGIVITSQVTTPVFPTQHRGYLRIGRALESDPLYLQMRSGYSNDRHYFFSYKGKTTSGAVDRGNVTLLLYDEDGVYYPSVILYLSPVGVNFGTGGFVETYGWFKFGSSIPSDKKFFAEIFIEFLKSGTLASFILNVDEFIISQEYFDYPPFPAVSSGYFDGETTGAAWYGKANQSKSYLNTGGKNKAKWGNTAPAADFDVDIGNMDELITDLEFTVPSIDSINDIIVIGGQGYEEIEWIYPGNGEQDHFDLETAVYPYDGDTFPEIWKNIGNDVSPYWLIQKPGTREDGFGTFVNVLYEIEDHWLQFETAPPNLKKSWRVTGRIKKRIRVRVQDELQIEANGIDTAGTIYNDTITSADAAHALGMAEINKRSTPKTISYNTYEPGLFPGDEQVIVDTARGINETMEIDRVTLRFLGGGYVIHSIEAGVREPDLTDIITQTHQLAEPKVPIEQAKEEITARYLYDDDEELLSDDNNQTLFDTGPAV